MRLKRLKLERYRNFSEKELFFAAKTAIIGHNGVGKSNILEAIRVLSVGKSFKTNRMDELIQFGEPYFRLTAFRQETEKEQMVELFYGYPFAGSTNKERSLRVDRQEMAWSDFWGSFPSVLFVPNDIEVVIGAPQLRRRYIDSVLWQVDKEFRHDHLELTRVLKERSSLLFLIKINRAGPQELSPWNELLEGLSQRIRVKRTELVAFLKTGLQQEAELLPNLDVRLEYKVNETEPKKVFSEEVRLSQNLVGPHRDELEIFFKDMPARRFTSRGQARAIIVLLKVAEAAFLAQKSGQKPVVLLDDMFSELDAPTAAALFKLFGDQYQLIASSIEENSLISDWDQIGLE